MDNSFYNLAAIHAFLGNKDKAYQYLRLIIQRQKIPLWIVNVIKIDPMFDSLRDEPDFQLIVKELEDDYTAEHERVKKWLEENDMF